MKFLPFFLFLNLSLFGQVNCATKLFDFTGFCFKYHENGKIAYIKEFKNDEAVGIWMKFDEKGNLISQLNTRDKKDSLDLIHVLYREIEFLGKKEVPAEEIFIDPEVEAIFPGGSSELRMYIQKNLMYPADIDVAGKVYVEFTIEIDGSITGIKVLRGIPGVPECEQEVVRVIKKMPHWIPAQENGKKVRSKYTIPVNFTLN